MWDTIWTFNHKSLKICPQLSQLLMWCVRSFTLTRVVCQPVWSAQDGILTRDIKSTVSIRLDSTKRKTGPCLALEVPSSGVTSMPTSPPTCLWSRPKSSSSPPSLSLATVTAVQVESFAWWTSPRTSVLATSFLTTTSRSNEEMAKWYSLVSNQLC